MKSLILTLLLLFAAQGLIAQANLDEQLTEFAEKHKLYNRKLADLEAARIDTSTPELKQMIRWKIAYRKWDHAEVTGSLCIEDLLPTGSCTYKYPPFHGVDGYPLAYLLELTAALRENGEISARNEMLLKNILIQRIDNRAQIETDINYVGEVYAKQLEKSRLNESDLKRIIQFATQSAESENFNDLKLRIEQFGEKEFTNLKAFLKGLGVGFDDVMYTLYDGSLSALYIGDDWKAYSFAYSRSFGTPMQMEGGIRSAVAMNFGTLIFNKGNSSDLNELDFLKFSPFFENETIAHVVLLKLLFDKWEKYEMERFRTSETDRYLRTIGLDADINLFLTTVERGFPKYYFWREFEMRSKSSIELLFLAAYNDIYSTLGIENLEGTLMEIDVMKFDFTDEQRGIISALLDPNEQATKTGLQNQLMGQAFNEFDTEPTFRLASHIAFYQKSVNINRDWNHAELFVDPFNSEKSREKVPVKSFNEEEFEECRSLMNEIIETTPHNDEVFYFTSMEGQGRIIPRLNTEHVYSFYHKMEEKMVEKEIYTNFIRIVATPNPHNPSKATNSELIPVERAAAPPSRPPAPPIFRDEHSSQSKVEAEIIEFPDVNARFPGGTQELKMWVAENIQYPDISRELGDKSRVYVTFVVEIDGSITQIEVMRGGVTEELNREAIRLVRNMPKWEPGKLNGKPVRVRFMLPITFTL